MSFFDDMGKRMNSLAQSAQKQIEVAKLQRRISDKQSECDGIYEQIGRLYYESRQRGAMPDEAIGELCNKLQKLMNEVSDMRAKIDVLSDIVRCPACKSVVVSGSTYCNKCGAKLAGALFEEKAAEQPAEAPKEAAGTVDEIVDEVIEKSEDMTDGIVDNVEKSVDDAIDGVQDTIEEGIDEIIEAAQPDEDATGEVPEASDETVHGPEY